MIGTAVFVLAPIVINALRKPEWIKKQEGGE
jgi:hypothetical protein